MDRGPVLPWQPPEVVEADHEEAVGVDGLAGSDAHVPPAWTPVRFGVVAGGMMVARQGVTHEDGVGLRRIEFAVGFVDEVEARQADAALELQRPKAQLLRCHDAYGIGRQSHGPTFQVPVRTGAGVYG